MDRKVPSATSEEIQLYRSTIYSLLRSTVDVKIRTIEEVHAGMNSLMHPGARSPEPDIAAFIYAYMRLPVCISEVKTLVLGQNADVFKRNGYKEIEEWQPVAARARRRRCFFDGKDILGCFIASRSDIEDVIPTLTAYQMEWNKLHGNLVRLPRTKSIISAQQDPIQWEQFAVNLGISLEDLNRLNELLGNDLLPMMEKIQSHELSFSVRLLNGSLSQYMRATHEWFEAITRVIPDLTERPIYFVSSNTHSLVNLVTGISSEQTEQVIKFIELDADGDLNQEWQQIKLGQSRSNKANFLYYALKKFQNSTTSRTDLKKQIHNENKQGITRISSQKTFDIEAQVIELDKINYSQLDPRLGDIDFRELQDSHAVILNIDYPLGLAAYNLLSTMTVHLTDIRGVYVMGKSASLNAARGDVIIPNVVQDEHSHNTYLFQNCFSAGDVAPYLNYGTILDNQKAISVLGTFLQNAHLMDVFYREGFADIEMELGNFCSAIYEATRPKRYPLNEIVNLYNIPLEFGALHYVSDTPMLKGKNLGEGTLSYYGMDSTYACSLAILRRIFTLETQRE